MSVGHYGSSNIDNLYNHLRRMQKEVLIDVVDDLRGHFYIAKLKITSYWYMIRSKATTRVRNTAG